MGVFKRIGLPISAAPRTLGLAAASNLLPKDCITELINEAGQDIEQHAAQFANGNSALQKGIEVQHGMVLESCERDEAAQVACPVCPISGM